MQNLQERVRFLSVLALALLFIGTVQPVHAGTAPITTLFSTGVDSSGSAITAGGTADPHYTVNGGTAFVINPPVGGWVPNTPTSSWISNAMSTLGGPGPFTYTTTFDLTGLVPSTAQIAGFLSADDQATIFLNGVDVFDGLTDPPSAPWSVTEAFSINTGFKAGVNTLDIVVPNNKETSNDGPTGLQIQITSATASTPEPASLALVGLGLGALKMFRRKQ